jgi:osomolarity two-component system, sensor histidine kinase SLN1
MRLGRPTPAPHPADTQLGLGDDAELNRLDNVLDLPIPVQSPRFARKKSARVLDQVGPRVRWARFKRRLGTATAPSTSSVPEETATTESLARVRSRLRGQGCGEEDGTDEFEDEDGGVDEVVVDREWLHDIKTSVVSPSESGGIGDRGNGLGYGGATVTDGESDAYHMHGFWGKWSPLLILRYRVWPAVFDFFCLRFYDPKSETQYKKENWFMRKVPRFPPHSSR